MGLIKQKLHVARMIKWDVMSLVLVALEKNIKSVGLLGAIAYFVDRKAVFL